MKNHAARRSLLLFIGFAARAAAQEATQSSPSFDSLVILGVGSSARSEAAPVWKTELIFSNPTATANFLELSAKPISYVEPAPGINVAGAVLPPSGSVTVPDINTAATAGFQLTTLYATPSEGFPLPTARARVSNGIVPSQSVDMPVFSLSTLISSNVSVLSFPGAVRSGPAHSNIILTNLQQRRRPGEPDLGDNVSLLIEAYTVAGQQLGSMSVTLQYGQTVFLVDILNLLGVPTLPDGTIRVSRASGTGFFWGVMPTIRPDGSLTASLGMNP